MAFAAAILVGIGITLFAVWGWCVLNLLAALRRADRSRSLTYSRRARLVVAELPSVLLYALFMTINVVTFIVGWAWYRVRGKPMPPPPAQGRPPG